ncbi:cation/H(+) antiporter 15-like [Camellia sinensis]|uniref:cation/H(+) antiporter 15-like n=1 Tax=Camellia sinensis TaxID=4442 RepID=UPI0010365D8A|nr:cation/H(+) antiporter 15-like [Camellia sinensis]
MGKPEMPPILSAPGMLANETVCYPSNMVTTNGIWMNENPLNYSLPLFLFQVLLIVLITRLLMFILKPLHQPRVFCEFIAGIILGPSALGHLKIEGFSPFLFSKTSLLLLETIANMGAIYFVFIIGLEMDLSVIRKYGKKALVFAIVGMFLPFLIACAFSFNLQKKTTMQEGTFMIFFAISLSITAFHVLARNLGELRLVDMEISKLAKSVALINEIFGVTLLVYTISLAESTETAFITSLWIILSSIIFVVFCILVVRPTIAWLIRRTLEEENFSDLTTSIIIAGVMFSSVISDAIGVHPIFGAFFFGLVIPNGPLAVTLVENLEDFVIGFLLPLFFVTSGLKTNLLKIQGASTWFMLMLSIILSSIGKTVGTILVALFYNVPFREGIALGLLMNTKGLIGLIALNLGKDQKVIDDTTYAIMVITVIFINAIITPILVKIYRPARKFIPYKRRTIQKTKTDSELRILVCIHTPRNVPTIINLLEASHPTKKSPISIFSLHLVELIGHASATLIDHNSQNHESAAINRMQAQSDNIINAFETFGQHTSTVIVQSFTAISPYSTMHGEICNLAEEKRAAFIIIPFHKQQMVDGGMEDANPKFRMMNQNLLANAPCSIGILIDRGLSGSTRLAASQVSHNIVVLFFGGPDDREALSYAMRMSEHPGNSLSVIRFLSGPEAIDPIMDPNYDNLKDHRLLTLQVDREKDEQLDDDYIKEFRMMKANDESFSYTEKVVNNGEETMTAIRSMENMHDLVIVGRREGTTSTLTTGLDEWSECPELGVIGDLLGSADFAATISVLVVQQYIGVGPHNEGIGTPDSGSQLEEHHIMDSSVRG